MTDALLFALLAVLVAAVVFLIYGQVKTLRALADVSESLWALAEDARREGVPLLREARATVAVATESLTSAQEAMRAARDAAESMQALGPLLQRMEPVVDEAREVVAHADETVVEARATVGTAQRVLAQVESTLGKLRLTDVALDLVKAKGGDAGRLAASAGLLVKSLWHRRPDRADGEGAEPVPNGPDGPEESDRNAPRSPDHAPVMDPVPNPDAS